MSDLKYNNTETKHTADGKTIVRKVVIHGGKGHKSVSVRSPKGKSRTAKRPLSDDEIRRICAREFIPGLFADCVRTPERGTSEGGRAIRGMRHMEHSADCEKADAKRNHHCSGINCRICNKSATLFTGEDSSSQVNPRTTTRLRTSSLRGSYAKRTKHLGGRKTRNNYSPAKMNPLR